MDFKQLSHLLKERDPAPSLHPIKIFQPDLTPFIAQIPEPLVRAGLFLLNDDLDACHEIAQATENADGNYWHAILHRREEDFGNARYWYRHVGPHPVLTAMREEYAGWDPMEFVAACEKASRQPTKELALLEEIQVDEMGMLLDYVRLRGK